MIQTSNTILIKKFIGHTAYARFLSETNDTPYLVKIKDHGNCAGELCGCTKAVSLYQGKHVTVCDGTKEREHLVYVIETDKMFLDPELKK